MKTKRFEGKVGDAVAEWIDGPDLVLRRAHVIDERGRGETACVLVRADTVLGPDDSWYRRADGVRATARGKPMVRGGEVHLHGLWLPEFGDKSIAGAANVKGALAAGSGANILDPRQRAVADHVRDLCAIFGVEAHTLNERLAANQKDPDDLAHNGLRKFAVGAIVHLAHEIDVAWQGKGVGVPRQGLRAVAEVPQLAGVHRGTLASFHAQFAALCGFRPNGTGGAGEPRSELGRFVRDRYRAVRTRAVEAAAVAAVDTNND